MFLKQEKPEWMILKETLILKKKYLQKVHKVFLHILLFQTILSIYIYFEKKLGTF